MQQQKHWRTNRPSRCNLRGRQLSSASGGLSVAVWKHKTEQGYDRYSIRIERTHKDDAGFKTTDYLRDSDLLRVQKLLDLADNWIEQEKAAYRSGAAQGQEQSKCVPWFV